VVTERRSWVCGPGHGMETNSRLTMTLERDRLSNYLNRRVSNWPAEGMLGYIQH